MKHKHILSLATLAILLMGTIGMAAAEPTFTFNTPDATGSYAFADSTPLINISVVNASDATNVNISAVLFSITNLSFNIIDTTLMDTNITMTNGSNTWYNYTYSVDFDSLPIGNYTLTAWANDTGNLVNESSVNFSITSTDTSIMETYIATLGGWTANFRNANNTADISGDMSNTTQYTAVFTTTATSVQTTVGKFTGATWQDFDNLDLAVSVGTGNDPSSITDVVRAWMDDSMFTGVQWAKTRFNGAYDTAYRLTGTSASPTWAEIANTCTNGTAYEDGTNTSNELPCRWVPGDGFTYVYTDSFSGVAVSNPVGGGTTLGGVGGLPFAPTTTVAPTVPPAVEDLEESGELGAALVKYFGWIIVAIVVVVVLVKKRR